MAFGILHCADNDICGCSCAPSTTITTTTNAIKYLQVAIGAYLATVATANSTSHYLVITITTRRQRYGEGKVARCARC